MKRCKLNVFLTIGSVLLFTTITSGVCPNYTFEELPVGTVVVGQYYGVTFSAPGGNCTGETYLIDMTNRGGTSSPSQALTTRPKAGCEFSPEYLRIDFDKKQNNISFTLGYYCGTYAIRGYDSRSNLIVNQIVTISDCTKLHGVHRFVNVTYPSASIVRLEIDGGSGAAETIDDLHFDIDTTPPVADITSPGFEACGCDPIAVYGYAWDPDGPFQRYILEYQPVGAAAWTTFRTSIYPVGCDCYLGSLDTSSLPQGYYNIRLTAENPCSMTASDITTVWVDHSWSSLILNTPVDGGIYGRTICFDGTVWDNHCFDHYTVDYQPIGAGWWQPVNPSYPTYTSSRVNDPFAYWNTIGYAIPDGDYQIWVQAIDQCNNTDNIIQVITVDNTSPLAWILNPTECDYVQGLVDIIGTALDANLDSWVLQFTGGDYPGWVDIASSSAPVYNGYLAQWDTTGLQPCAYTLRLVVTDQSILDCDGHNRNRTETTVSIHVGLPGDIDGNGIVDMNDLALLSANWLKTMP